MRTRQCKTAELFSQGNSRYHHRLRMRAKRILLVEDDADLRRLFRTALTIAGYEVEETGDGFEALGLVDSHPPDLVVLDLILRSLDGVSVQQELASRALTSRIPIVIVTGSDLPIDGVACVLRKPVSPEEIVRTVQKCLRAGAPASGA